MNRFCKDKTAPNNQMPTIVVKKRVGERVYRGDKPMVTYTWRPGRTSTVPMNRMVETICLNSKLGGCKHLFLWHEVVVKALGIYKTKTSSLANLANFTDFMRFSNSKRQSIATWASVRIVHNF